jgi:hypothetical protein
MEPIQAERREVPAGKGSAAARADHIVPGGSGGGGRYDGASAVYSPDGTELLVGTYTACGGLPSLMWFAPATNTVTPLLGGAANGGYTGGAMLFGEAAYIRA